jgi:hypothetical protein
MSLTDSNKKKNYSNKTNNNIKVAKNDKVKDHFGKGGLLYKGKAKDYPGITKIIKKNKLKIIPINIGPGKKKK